jgi:hypothetical protein
MSNGTWKLKREGLEKNSLLMLNRELLEHAGSEWDEAKITARTERLIKVIAEVWKGPQGAWLK